jgi:hypothetical protein
MKLPRNTSWTQSNRSDVLGDLRASFNLDLTKNFGKTRLNRLKAVALGFNNTPVAYATLQGGTGAAGIYAMMGSFIYKSSTFAPNSTYSVDVQTNSPTNGNSLYCDMCIFNGYLYATNFDVSGGGTDKLYKLNSTWAANGTNIGSSGNQFTHMLCPYGARLYITNGNAVYSMDTSDTIATSSTYTVSFPTNIRVTFVKAASNRLWIGTLDLNRGKAKIYEWDGVSTQVTRGYEVKSIGVLSGVINDDILYAMDADGRLLVQDASRFREIARLPINEMIFANSVSTKNDRYIHPNGMTIHDGNVNIFINNLLLDYEYPYPEFCPSGLWEYNDSIGLYHKGSPSYAVAGSTTSTDYGQELIYHAGAISEMKSTVGSSGDAGTILIGATIYNTSAAQSSGLFYNDTLKDLSATYAPTRKGGYIVTDQIPSRGIKDSWGKLTAFYKKFSSSDDKIIVKYRTDNSFVNKVKTITWTSTTTFTYSGTTLEFEKYDEVEFIQGSGSGFITRITNIESITSSTIRITIEDIVTSATGSGLARFQKWKWIQNIQDQDSFSKDVTLGTESSWIEFKIWISFTRPDQEIEKFDLSSEPKQLLT